MYYQPETGRVFGLHSEIRAALPHVMFGASITEDDLSFVGIFTLRSEAPVVDAGQVAERVAVDLVDEQWTQLWTVRDMTSEELDQLAAAVELQRDEKRVQIDQWRAEANASAFPHGGKLIACDALSRSDLDGVAHHIALFAAFPEGFPGGWKATDKTMLPLADVDAFRAMYASMTAQGAENFNHSQELKARLAAASTPDEIAAIAW